MEKNIKIKQKELLLQTMKVIKRYNFKGWAGISKTRSRYYIPSSTNDLKNILYLANANGLKILPVDLKKVILIQFTIITTS